MVELINPQLGEVVLDPACGTGGFLVESYTHLAKQATTVQSASSCNKPVSRDAKLSRYRTCW